MARPEALDRFRAVLAGATRAIARDPDVEVVYASDASGQSPGKVARVVSPGPSLEPRLVAEARGAAFQNSDFTEEATRKLMRLAWSGPFC